MPETTVDEVLEALRGAGETTRLRILAVLSAGELAVSELTQILGQSQPRISRHLKLLVEAGLIERRREGAWAFFDLAKGSYGAALVEMTLAALPESDAELMRDRERLTAVRRRRAEAAEAYFRENATAWDELRALHAPEEAVEAAARAMLSDGAPYGRLLDLGAGTGRMLELFADRFATGVGYDTNQQMLALARARLDRCDVGHAALRQNDILSLPEDDASADAVVIHQVLHFLSEPDGAIAEAARVLKPGGQLLIVDFAPHTVEELRENHAHRRLGFSRAEIDEYLGEAGLLPVDHREIAPPSENTRGLAVLLWLARRPTIAPQSAE